MTTDKKCSILNGGLTAPLRNILMIIAILSALITAIAAVTSRASKTDVVAVSERVTVTEVRGKYRDEKLDKIEKKIDWLINHQK